MQSLSNVEKGGTIVSRNALPINAMPLFFASKKDGYQANLLREFLFFYSKSAARTSAQ
jgi:hypothetical protein